MPRFLRESASVTTVYQRTLRATRAETSSFVDLFSLCCTALLAIPACRPCVGVLSRILAMEWTPGLEFGFFPMLGSRSRKRSSRSSGGSTSRGLVAEAVAAAVVVAVCAA